MIVGPVSGLGSRRLGSAARLRVIVYRHDGTAMAIALIKYRHFGRRALPRRIDGI
ncbi:hypothetical protein [Hamadaea tsunoensis]|uniref:hypothetical protein n=1 Tax=Hamadaea tsunoensis TaxID=53368 RepID=UPI000402EE3A|nr:hypothetical protein [Hamadaea tsunoensis]